MFSQFRLPWSTAESNGSGSSTVKGGGAGYGFCCAEIRDRVGFAQSSFAPRRPPPFAEESPQARPDEKGEETPLPDPWRTFAATSNLNWSETSKDEPHPSHVGYSHGESVLKGAGDTRTRNIFEGATSSSSRAGAGALVPMVEFEMSEDPDAMAPMGSYYDQPGRLVDAASSKWNANGNQGQSRKAREQNEFSNDLWKKSKQDLHAAIRAERKMLHYQRKPSRDDGEDDSQDVEELQRWLRDVDHDMRSMSTSTTSAPPGPPQLPLLPHSAPSAASLLTDLSGETSQLKRTITPDDGSDSSPSSVRKSLSRRNRVSIKASPWSAARLSQDKLQLDHSLTRMSTSSGSGDFGLQSMSSIPSEQLEDLDSDDETTVDKRYYREKIPRCVEWMTQRMREDGDAMPKESDADRAKRLAQKVSPRQEHSIKKPPLMTPFEERVRDKVDEYQGIMKERLEMINGKNVDQARLGGPTLEPSQAVKAAVRQFHRSSEDVDRYYPFTANENQFTGDHLTNDQRSQLRRYARDLGDEDPERFWFDTAEKAGFKVYPGKSISREHIPHKNLDSADLQFCFSECREAKCGAIVVKGRKASLYGVDWRRCVKSVDDGGLAVDDPSAFLYANVGEAELTSLREKLLGNEEGRRRGSAQHGPRKNAVLAKHSIGG